MRCPGVSQKHPMLAENEPRRGQFVQTVVGTQAHPPSTRIPKKHRKKTETKGRLHYAKHKQQTMSPSC
jgi:hypothetical protein